jgi:hypothetical protein
MHPIIRIILQSNSEIIYDNWQTWVSIGGLDPASYANLAGVIANSTAKSTLCNHLEALRYMVKSPSIISAVLADSGWVTALDGSTYAIHVPTMTSITTPSGEVVSSGSIGTNTPHKAFDKNTSTFWGSNTGSGKYLGYKFTKSIHVYKMTIYTGSSGDSLKTAMLQYAPDGISWIDLVSFTDLATGVAGTKTKILSTITQGVGWRLMDCVRYDGNTTNDVTAMELDFFGLDLT